MKLHLRLNKPEKRTVTVTLPADDGYTPCLKDLCALAVQHLGLTTQADSGKIGLSLNNRDILSGDDVPLNEFGIVGGDLIYVHAPDDLLPEVAAPSATYSQTISSETSACDTPHETDSSSKMETSSSSHSAEQDAMICLPENRLLRGPVSGVESQAASCPTINDVEELDVKEINKCLRQAILIRESDGDDIPESLRSVLNEASPISEQQALFLVIHVLVMETGFVLKNPEVQLLPKQMSSSYFRLDYRCRGEIQKAFSLVASPMGGMLLVTALSQNTDAMRYSVSLKTAQYVRMTNQGPKFKKLSHLSREVKDKVSYPMLQHLTNETDNRVPSLVTLLYEIKILILKCLDAPSLLRLSETCTIYNELCKTPILWQRLFTIEFGKSKAANRDVRSDWYQLYKERYLLRKQIRDHCSYARVVVPPFVGDPGLYSPLTRPSPWIPPFMVGGDYDRLPVLPGMGGCMVPQSPRFDPIRPPLPDNPEQPGQSNDPRIRFIHSNLRRGVGSIKPFGASSGMHRFF